ITWHGLKPDQPAWEPSSRFVACMLSGAYARLETGEDDNDIFMAFNASPYNYTLTLPDSPSGNQWKKVIDTALAHPRDIIDPADVKDAGLANYQIKRRSTQVYIA
ncbi:MAG: hypothetical protein ACRCUT_04240, partial [Spirochaetota bacterium]